MMDIALLKNIKMLLTDVDGVMTDATLWLDSERQWKRRFSVYDGVGMKLLMEKGYQVGVITGGKSDDVKIRMEFLGLHHFYDGIGDKVPPFEEILKKTGLKASEVAYIGDEIFDIPIIERVGVGVSVPNGIEEAKKKAKYITRAAGGQGAVREVCDWILKHGFYK